MLKHDMNCDAEYFNFEEFKLIMKELMAEPERDEELMQVY